MRPAPLSFRVCWRSQVMRNWSIPIGRVFGIDVRLHLTFLFLLIFVWFTESINAGPVGAARGLALVGMIFVSVVLHEAGHALIAMHAQLPVRTVILLPIGGVALMDDAAFHLQQD